MRRPVAEAQQAVRVAFNAEIATCFFTGRQQQGLNTKGQSAINEGEEWRYFGRISMDF